MEITHNVVGWFEIPVTNIERAMKFYETVFDLKLSRNQMGPLDMAWFPGVQNGMGAAGSLVYQKEFHKPSAEGTMVYLTAFSGDLSNELKKVVSAGGKVVVPKTLITEEIGYMGVFIDTEGNRVAVHSRK
jgi:uncharacterized protein